MTADLEVPLQPHVDAVNGQSDEAVARRQRSIQAQPIAARRPGELTVTGELKQKNGVMMRLEYRRDMSDTRFFVNRDSALVKSQDTFTVGFIYAFSTKAP